MSGVIFSEHRGRDGKRIAEIRLDSERTLNALTLEMIELIQPRLDAWREDPQVVAILLDSAGQKAFCAGGDIVRLYQSMQGEGDSDFPERYFTHEYRLDYSLHTYPKPVICWGSGIVMGGGMGLLSGCSHRIVTERSHLAMPEVSIGLYPDVGASWFLNRLPRALGEFIALTGCALNAPDALYLGLADRALSAQLHDELLPRLLAQSWQGESGRGVSRVLRELEQASATLLAELDSPLRRHRELIRQLMDRDSLADKVAAILSQDVADAWFQRAQKNLASGSPLAMAMTLEQLRRGRHWSLKEAFQHELVLSVQTCRQREFPEGIRARLIDKDNRPVWMFGSLAEVDPELLASLFESPWGEHPLRAL
ncbi:enoyl-CoA hydratase/isomerase family protein [Zobellella maritima]|uniref:enoyl-CoA hydratase/isomerase family protein n=1 Tax=Zobellella maritima TaxID=2059725 RepID=UPI000E30383E|nr:enoyl-CoA hydratase/isomerase family protein [Zobellella maritima]